MSAGLMSGGLWRMRKQAITFLLVGSFAASWASAGSSGKGFNPFDPKGAKTVAHVVSSKDALWLKIISPSKSIKQLLAKLAAATKAAATKVVVATKNVKPVTPKAPAPVVFIPAPAAPVSFAVPAP